MADVYMTVFESAAEVALGDPIQYASAVIGGANSAPITGTGRKRKRVYVYATAASWIKWGANPTATGATDSTAIGADNPMFIDIEAGHVLTAIARV